MKVERVQAPILVPLELGRLGGDGNCSGDQKA